MGNQRERKREEDYTDDDLHECADGNREYDDEHAGDGAASHACGLRKLRAVALSAASSATKDEEEEGGGLQR